MQEKGKIIFLNGVSSAGKSSLAKAIQEASEREMYHLAGDTILHMLNEKLYESGSLAEIVARLRDGLLLFVLSVKLFSDHGKDLVMDTVCVDDGLNHLNQIIDTLKGYPVMMVQVDCSPEALDRREAERGDRQRGQARGQLAMQHPSLAYDLRLDSSKESCQECARKVLDLFENPSQWKSFELLRAEDYISAKKLG
ncbi:MAG: adenylyl-sulfate kinase [Anaerolineaceae bacterium]|nr:adenylyl-sulfate kinase [Anaerolineaceae bacterium]